MRNIKFNPISGSKSICIAKATKRINSELDPNANPLLKHESFVSLLNILL